MAKPSAFRGRSCIAIAAVCFVAGCTDDASKTTAHLKGTVTIRQEPIPDDAFARIYFRPTQLDQGATAYATISDGKYDVPSVPTGMVTVTFSIQQATGRQVSEGLGAPTDEIISLVPERYGVGISLEVTGDNNQQDFDLTE